MTFGIPEPETTSWFESMILGEDGAGILVLLAVMIFIGCCIGWFCQKRIRYYKTIKLRVSERKIQAKHLIKILEGLARTNCEQRVRDLIGARLIDIIEQIMDINPLEPGIKVIHDACHKLTKIPPNQMTYDTSVADNDAEVRELQRIVLAAIAQLKKLPRRGLITYSELKTLEHHLKMIYVQVEVDAHLHKATLAQEDGDRGTAGNHYRIAQNKLAQSRYHGPEKRSKMVEIGNTIRALFERPEASG